MNSCAHGSLGCVTAGRTAGSHGCSTFSELFSSEAAGKGGTSDSLRVTLPPFTREVSRGRGKLNRERERGGSGPGSASN